MPIAATATAATRGPRATEPRPLGIMDSIRATLATTSQIVRTRLEIISTEIEEQREWLQNIMLLAVAGVFCACMGMVVLTLFVVALFWESHPVAVLGGFSAVYIAVGAWAILTLRHKLHTRPKLFSTTTDELAKDEARLNPRAQN